MLQLFGLGVTDVQSLLYSCPALVDEVVEALVQELDEEFAQRVPFVAADLQQQAFLQRARSDAGRVELLKDLEHLSQLVGIRVEALVNLGLVGKDGEGLLQQSVLIERADEVFHEFLLVVGEFEVGHLLAETVGERERVVVRHVLGGVVAVAVAHQEVGHVVLRAVVVGGIKPLPIPLQRRGGIFAAGFLSFGEVM